VVAVTVARIDTEFEGGIHQTSTSTDGITACTFSADVHATGLNLITGTGHLQHTNVSFVCA
jgi:hypothetical protein